jgi:hypothetical protein
MDAKTSFDAFVLDAWNMLLVEESKDVAARKSVSLILRQLYRSASAPAGVKDPLTPPELYGAMALYIGNAIPAFGAPLKMKLQGYSAWDLTARANDVVAYYTAQAAAETPPVEPWQKLAIDVLPGGYLHVYPGTPAPDPDWRIALNVVPADMAKAMGLCAPLLQEPSAIGHIKFFGPAGGSKCDSVLCYMRKDGGYAGLRAQFLAIARQLTLQDCVGKMWDEDPDVRGFGEAAEPPKELGVYRSFTAYRCLVIYLAFKTFAMPAEEEDSFGKFQDHLAQVMTQFGLDFAQPQLQARPLPASLTGAYRTYLDLYLQYKKTWGENG